MVEDMKVREGYKKTEVGVIPEDWEVKELSEISKITMGQSPNSQFYNSDQCGLPLVQGNADIKNRKTMDRIYTTEVTKKCNKNDLIMTVRAPVGKIAKASYDSCIGRGVCAIEGKCDYLYHFLINMEKSWLSLSKGSTFDSINSEDVYNLEISIPNIEEQKAIAKVLNDTDNLIHSIQKLIDKKEKIKKGTMQQLLTGKKRLDGFSGEWEVKALGDVSDIRTGKKDNENKMKDGKYPFFVRSQHIERINSYSYDGEAILIPGEGRIGSIYHYINGKFDYHQRVYKISDFKDVEGKYVYYFMKQTFNEHAMRNSVKATVDSLRLPTFQEFEIYCPINLAEQKAISKILSDMDQEIETLKEKLEKYKTIKQGMMQELLTGRIRLI